MVGDKILREKREKYAMYSEEVKCKIIAKKLAKLETLKKKLDTSGCHLKNAIIQGKMNIILKKLAYLNKSNPEVEDRSLDNTSEQTIIHGIPPEDGEQPHVSATIDSESLPPFYTATVTGYPTVVEGQPES